MKKTFKACEVTERFLAQKYFQYSNITDFELAQIGSFHCTDGYYRCEGNKTVFEIKVRNYGKDRFKDFILELKKARQLLEFHDQGVKVTYINFFKEEIGGYSVVEFDMSARFDHWLSKGKSLKDVSVLRSLPKFTAGKFKERVEKQCIMLRPSKKIDKITYVDDGSR